MGDLRAVVRAEAAFAGESGVAALCHRSPKRWRISRIIWKRGCQMDRDITKYLLCGVLADGYQSHPPSLRYGATRRDKLHLRGRKRGLEKTGINSQ